MPVGRPQVHSPRDQSKLDRIKPLQRYHMLLRAYPPWHRYWGRGALLVQEWLWLPIRQSRKERVLESPFFGTDRILTSPVDLIFIDGRSHLQGSSWWMIGGLGKKYNAPSEFRWTGVECCGFLIRYSRWSSSSPLSGPVIYVICHSNELFDEEKNLAMPASEHLENYRELTGMMSFWGGRKSSCVGPTLREVIELRAYSPWRAASLLWYQKRKADFVSP